MKLPESWVECRLTPLLTCLETGGRPSGGVGEIESGIPSISGEHFNWRGEFNFSSLKYIPESYYQTLQTGILRHGDVLIVKDGATTAKCAYIDENFPFQDAAINEHVFLVRTNPNLLDSRYLFELLRSEFGKAQILRNYRGAAIGGIPRGFTDHIKLPLPTYPEQQRIIDVLRQAEALIALQQTRGGQLDLMIKAYLDSLVLKVDESDWTQLGNLVETRYGTSVSADEEVGTGTPVLRIPNVIGGEVDTADMKYVGLSTSELERLFGV
jgi:type I restriction enzyme, S subunit